MSSSTTTLSAADDNEDFNEQFESGFAGAHSKLGRFNLAIFGQTGAGKSTLVNAVFGAKVAETGIGLPVSTETTYYVCRDGLLGLYDSKGFETGQSAKDISKFMSKEIETLWKKPAEERLHVIWYVMSATSKRIDAQQMEFMRELNGKGLPLIVVLTHTDKEVETGHYDEDAIQFADEIANAVGDYIVGGRPVMVQSIARPKKHQPAHGLEALLDATFLAAPAGVRNALIAAQQLDLKSKREAAEVSIALAATAAGAMGFVPVPFADAPMIVGAQVTMMAAIAAQYGLLVDKSHMTSLAKIALFSGGSAAVAGRGLASVLKLVPGIGTVIGGTINAAVAGAITTGVGYAWIAVCEHLASLDIAEREDVLAQTEMITGLFKSSFGKSLPPIDLSAFPPIEKSA